MTELDIYVNATGRDVDDIDRQIIKVLHDDPRATNKAVAGVVEISEASVASRIRRMISADIIRFTLQRNGYRQGYKFQAVFYLTVRGRSASDIAADIAQAPEARSGTVALVQGKADIVAFINCRDHEDVSTFISLRLARIAGIDEISVDVTMGFLKYETQFAMIYGSTSPNE